MYPHRVDYWPTLLDLEADDNHKRHETITVPAMDIQDAAKRFAALQIPHVHAIIHEPMLRCG